MVDAIERQLRINGATLQWDFVAPDQVHPQWTVELSMTSDKVGRSRRAVRVTTKWRFDYGGSTFLASRDERHAVIHCYSGQGTHSYELFRISPDLTHLHHVGDTPGYSDGPVFSEDSRYMLTMSTPARFRGLDGGSGVVGAAALWRPGFEPRGPVGL